MGGTNMSMNVVSINIAKPLPNICENVMDRFYLSIIKLSVTNSSLLLDKTTLAIESGSHCTNSATVSLAIGCSTPRSYLKHEAKDFAIIHA